MVACEVPGKYTVLQGVTVDTPHVELMHAFPVASMMVVAGPSVETTLTPGKKRIASK